ncbi:MAG: FG-GAP repeat protein, partial [Planctomycetes bacterium]|nr:FG-GAP repeat protein [Planctomycetota bacterium]
MIAALWRLASGTARSAQARPLSLLLGSTVALSSLALDAQDFTLESAQSGAFFGTSISSIDDLDGDGRPEIVVGSPGYDVDVTGDGIAESDVGRVEIFASGDHSLLLSIDG